jgi:cytochrome P450
VPERFDHSIPDNKWLLTADGKPRNPLAFTPFFGGKRICLGKSFAELAIRFTIPLLYFHFDFEFADPKLMHSKEQYGIANKREPSFKFKLKIKNQAN